MRARSKKMQAAYRLRRELVAGMLAERPICERCGTARSTDIHEIKSRGRGGSILDETNCAALCRTCHDFVTTHPAQAHLEGWSKNSWE